MKESFDYRDGWLCIKTQDTISDEPKMIIRWYPVYKEQPTYAEELIGKPAIYDGSGIYCEHRNGQAIPYRLRDGGNTVPMFVETTTVERPTTKRQTRWHYGQWQALFKTGWQSI